MERKLIFLWEAPLVTTVIPPPESVTGNLRTDASEIIRESDREDWPFRLSLKDSCNEKLSKVGVIEVGEIKTRAGKQGTHSKGFRENIKFLRALNTPAAYKCYCFSLCILRISAIINKSSHTVTNLLE